MAWSAWYLALHPWTNPAIVPITTQTIPAVEKGMSWGPWHPGLKIAFLQAPCGDGDDRHDVIVQPCLKS